jgi:UDP-N-acetyl-2-amino-2-deoxyglucuronate dehydrogenase
MEGRLPVAVMAMLANVMHDNSEVEDLSLAILEYSDGSLAQVTSSVIHHGEDQGIELQCANAKLSVPWNLKAEISKSNGFPEERGNQELLEKIQALYQETPDLLYEGHTGEIDDILRAIENGTRPMITGEDGRKTVELITAIYKAGCLKERVMLPISQEEEYYSFEGILNHAVRFHKKTSSVENFTDTDITLGSYQS